MHVRSTWNSNSNRVRLPERIGPLIVPVDRFVAAITRGAFFVRPRAIDVDLQAPK